MDLIITVDHEIFGNGSGCLESCVRKPVDKITSVANNFSAPVTFFVETLEYREMLKVGFDGIDAVISQLQEIYKQGHDVQLHLHPQWTGADWNGNEWELDNDRWRLGDLDQDEIYTVLSEGKQWLEEMMREYSPGYKCIAFRAGGWCIQPSQYVVKALKELGFKVDSTVAPGMKNTIRGEWADFKNVPDKPYWQTNIDVCNDDGSGIMEVPILTANIGRINHFSCLLKSRLGKDVGFADGCTGSYQGSSSTFDRALGKVVKLMRMGDVMLDFSTMPLDVLIKITRLWIEKYDSGYGSIPLVGIAHTKNFTEKSSDVLSQYLQWAKDNNISFSTYGQWLDNLYE